MRARERQPSRNLSRIAPDNLFLVSRLDAGDEALPVRQGGAPVTWRDDVDTVSDRGMDLLEAKIAFAKERIAEALEHEVQRKREKVCRKNGGHFWIAPRPTDPPWVCGACGKTRATGGN